MRPSLPFPFRSAAVVLIVLIAAASSAKSSPEYMMRTPGDSVLVMVGNLQQWVDIEDVVSPDTTYLDIQQDLVLASSLDTLTIPWNEGQATVSLVRDSDILVTLFRFESGAAEDLRRRVALLSQYSRFETDPSEAPIEFAIKWNPASLEELRRTFSLEKIAGAGDDLSRMRNLRHWLNDNVRYDGSRENPGETSVVANLRACMQQDKTMNCGGMASSYVAVCTAVGLSARQIVCRSFDPDDPDCHSVTIVYSDSLGHWVYMDPSFDAEWTDDLGHPLDLQMARDRLVRGEPVIVNPDAQVNGKVRSGLDHLAYMAKNLFRFQTWIDGKTPVHLVPKGYDPVYDGDNSTIEDAGQTVVTTNHPDRFWAPPHDSDSDGP